MIGYDGATVPAGTEVLGWIKAEAGSITHRACPLPMVAGAMCLCGIFDDLKTMSLRDREHRVHIGGLAVKMDRYDGSAVGAKMTLDLIRIDVVSPWIDIHKNRRCPRMNNCFSGGNKAVRRYNDFISVA